MDRHKKLCQLVQKEKLYESTVDPMVEDERNKGNRRDRVRMNTEEGIEGLMVCNRIGVPSQDPGEERHKCRIH